MQGRLLSSLRLRLDRSQCALQEAEATAKTPRASSKRPAQVTVIEGALLLPVTAPPAEACHFTNEPLYADVIWQEEKGSWHLGCQSIY